MFSFFGLSKYFACANELLFYQTSLAKKTDSLKFLASMSDNFRNNHKWTRDDFQNNHNYAYGVVLHIILHCHHTGTSLTVRRPSGVFDLCLPTISKGELEILETQVLGLIGEIRCVETGVVLVFFSGNRMEMLSLDQGNPELNGDSVGQSWSSVCWGYNR